jgi:guanosine-3',5'-bis(diphosphate) 3'-pyrophosphohydrolase
MRQDAVSRILGAADAAARWHATQRRKGTVAEPYINHLLDVARMVDAATFCSDPNLVIAALLHDAIEDQGVSRATIAEQFGEDVATLVAEVTDDKSLPQDERGRLQVQEAPKKSRRAKILKLADKISNVTAVANDPPSDWPVDRQRQYVQWGRDVVAGMRGASPQLEQQFDEAAANADRLIDAR